RTAAPARAVGAARLTRWSCKKRKGIPQSPPRTSPPGQNRGFSQRNLASRGEAKVSPRFYFFRKYPGERGHFDYFDNHSESGLGGVPIVVGRSTTGAIARQTDWEQLGTP